MPCKILVAFDFDHTIVEGNSDIWVRKLAPDGEIPKNIKDMYRDNDWTEFMGEIFKYLHINGTTPAEIQDLMKQLPFVQGMKELFGYLEQDCFDTIIISDANSEFISCIMNASGLQDVVNSTYTNPAWWSDDGCLKIAYYHTQDWCDLSTRNLCKGHILKDHISQAHAQGQSYDHVIYIGDGSNDLCPALTLRPTDFVMPRRGYKLLKLLQKDEHSIQAGIEPWDNGHDILTVLKGIMS